MFLTFFFSRLKVGDFATQALISSILYRAFPDDPIVGEEDSSDLRVESGKEMKDRIVELANEALTYELESGDNRSWGIGPGEQQSDTRLLDAIDRGKYEGGRIGRKMLFFVCCYDNKKLMIKLLQGMWTIDPIDGTKGFLRGEQYSVCVSFIVDSIVQVGVIGCPNLPVNPQSSEQGTGCIFVAVRGQGARQVSCTSASIFY